MTQCSRRALIGALCLWIVAATLRGWAQAPQPPAVSAVAAVLMDATTGTVLVDKAMHQRRPIASTTKIMTALLALESSNLDEMVTIGEDAVKVESPGLDFTPGERMVMSDLLAALLLKSSNSAAIAIADHISGSVPAFAKKMNERAASLGLKDTHLANPHGLSAPDHYSSAYDLAVMTREALNYDRFREIVAEKMTEIARPDRNAKEIITNHNKLLWRADYVDGVKTGWVRDSGHCLVASATKNGWQLISVVLDSGDTYSDALVLLNFGFANYQQKVFARQGDAVGRARVRLGRLSFVPAICQQTLAQVTGPGLPPAGRLQVSLKTAKAPVAQGEAVGEAQLSVDGQVVASSPLLAGEQVPRSRVIVAIWWLVKLAALLLVAAAGIRTGAKLVKARRRRRRGLPPQSGRPYPGRPGQG
jgi:D-alanyl-D-alanine carboxypeptidase (penicillin-binding protein 5/6)